MKIWEITLRAVKTKPVHVYQCEVGWELFPLYFFSFLRLPGWLVRLLLWNVLWDKRSGDPETQWPPGEASLSFSLSMFLCSHSLSLSVHILSSLFLPFFFLQSLFSFSAFPPSSPLFSLTHFFSLSVFCSLMWCRPRYSRLASFFALWLFTHTHTHTCRHTTLLCSYGLQQHRLVHAQKSHKHNLKHTLSHTGMCGNLPLATSVTCIWSWWGAKKPTDPGD